MKRRELLQMALAAGGSATLAGPAAAELGVNGEARNGDLIVRAGIRPLLTYRRTPVPSTVATKPLQTRNAYIHPLHTPNGAVVTDDFPPDHLHQRGVFFAWTKTRISLGGRELHPDFWNIGDGTGRIRSMKAALQYGGDGINGFTAEHAWEAKNGEEWEQVLEESWSVDLPAALQPANPDAPDARYVFDLTSRQRPRIPIELPVYRYGGMCVRGARSWTTPGMTVLTSEGKDWPHADSPRARWVDQSGTVDGTRAGVTLMEHPSTPGAPNLLRVPPELPYAVFCPSKGAPLTLEAGKEYVFRYRVVAHNGPAHAATLDELWQEFSKR